MAKNWIVRGDPTSSGGTVISGSPFTDIDGIAVARITDQATCPAHKGVFPIVDGDATLVVDGQPVALHGSSLACGCKVLSAQQMHVFVDAGASAGDGAASIAPAAVQTAAALMSAPAQYDEAIRFVNASGAGLAGVAYTLYLGSGETVSGTTDEGGKTQRIVTNSPERIVRAELKPEATPCCPMHAWHAADHPDVLDIDIPGLATNDADVGASVQQVETRKGKSRDLTAGEIAIARLVFGDSIKYEKVKVHNGEYLWFGMQPDNTAMTPNGEMYFNPKHFKEDFSLPADINGQQWFMHEMAHVWQHQLGYPVKWRGAVRVGLSYKYTLAVDKRLSDFNMEAQGNVLADYFVLKFRNRQTDMYEDKYWYEPDALTLFEAVLEDFLKDPGDKRNLP